MSDRAPLMNNISLIFGSLLVGSILYLNSGVAMASIIQCQDESCFIEQAAECNKNTSFLTPKIAGAQIHYSIDDFSSGRAWFKAMGENCNGFDEVNELIKAEKALCLPGYFRRHRATAKATRMNPNRKIS